MEAIALIADIHANLLAAEAVLVGYSSKAQDLTASFLWATRSTSGPRRRDTLRAASCGKRNLSARQS